MIVTGGSNSQLNVCFAPTISRLRLSVRSTPSSLNVSNEDDCGGDYENHFLNRVHGFPFPFVIGFIGNCGCCVNGKLGVVGGGNRVFWFVGRTGWSSAFRLFPFANLLKHELQPFTSAKEKTLAAATSRCHLEPTLAGVGGTANDRRLGEESPSGLFVSDFRLQWNKDAFLAVRGD